MLLDNPLLKGFCFATDHRAASGAEPKEFIDPDDTSPAAPVEPGAGPLDDDDIGIETDDDETVEVDNAGEDSLAARVATPPDLGEVWKQHGIEGLPSDPRQILSVYQQQQEQARQLQELRQQNQWFQWNQQQQLVAQQAQQRPQEKPKPVFELPEWNPEWPSLVYQDENGNVVAKNGVDPTIPQKIAAFAKARENVVTKFFQDPMGSLQQHFMPLIQQTAQQIAQQQVQQYAAIQELKSFERENAAWVFQNGKDMGQGLTPAANTFNRYYAEAISMGHPQPMEYARRGLDAELTPIALQQLAEREVAASLPAANKSKDREFIKQAAARQSSRTGAVPNGTTKKQKPRPDGAFPRNRLLESLKALPEEALARLGEPE